MDTRDNKQLVIDGFRLFQSGDIPTLLGYFHDDADWISPESPSVPFSGNFHGKGEIAQFFAKLDAFVQPVHFATREFIAEGDKVVVIGDASWIVKSTGRGYDSPWVNVFALHDGKIMRADAYHDTAPAERAFRGGQAGQVPSFEMRH